MIRLEFIKWNNLEKLVFLKFTYCFYKGKFCGHV